MRIALDGSFVLAVTALTGDCFLYDWIKMGTKIK
jgi:hypothetical protein